MRSNLCGVSYHLGWQIFPRSFTDGRAELDCLRHLQELCVDGNAVNNLEGLENMKDLMKLSVEANRLQELDFGKFHWCVFSTPPRPPLQ